VLLAVAMAVITAAVALGASVGLSPAQTHAQQGFTVDHAPLVSPVDCETSCVVVGHSSIIRADNVVTYGVRASLGRLRVYTVWAFAFNNPQACASSPCGAADLGDPDTQPTLFRLDSANSDSAGTVLIFGLMRAGGQAGATVFGGGLTNPEGAELHLVLRNHGRPSLTGLLSEPGSYLSGCNPDVSRCQNQAIAIHD